MAVLVGGIIPEADIPALKAAGIAGIFLPGTSTQEIVEFVRAHVRARRVTARRQEVRKQDTLCRFA